ncbi:MAG: hypothetical protein HQ551_13820, partial [Desulfobacteraceae bacterium]|nr:hypothetical protein [Desulfobacteraceae bacterium]
GYHSYVKGKETFGKLLILFKFKEEENIALALHFVQPQEYIGYFEDSAKASLRARFESDAGTLVKLLRKLGKRRRFAKV